MTIADLRNAFARVSQESRKALLPFLMSGHPTPEAFAANLEAAGEFADVIEVGVPFSDPLADGPVIQEAGAQSLKNGTTLAATLETLRARKPGPPVVLMLSFNQVLAGGIEQFADRAVAAKVSGAIIPDLPFDEQDELRKMFAQREMALIAMLSPTTSEARMRQILTKAEGFAYLISVAGVTGTRDAFGEETVEYIRRAKSISPVPLCVGFGISKAQHIEQLRKSADGFIVGSALIRGLGQGSSVADILGPLRKACDGEVVSKH